MKKTIVLAALFIAAAVVTGAEPRNLADFNSPDILKQFIPVGQKDAAFKLVDGSSGKALQFSSKLGDTKWPGGALTGLWDVSEYGRIEVGVYNPSAEKIRVWLRVDDAGKKTRRPQATAYGDLAPGTTTNVVLFLDNNGYGKNYILDKKQINQIFLYLYDFKKDQDLRIDYIRAAGEPGELPAWMPKLIEPENGVLADFKAADLSSYIGVRAGSFRKESDGSIRAIFQANNKHNTPGLIISQPKTRWNLSQYDQAEFTVRNPGTVPSEIYVSMTNQNNVDPNSGTKVLATVAPGETKTILLPFKGNTAWHSTVQSDNKARTTDAASERATGAAETGATGYYSDETFGAIVGPADKDKGAEIIIEKIVCSVSPPAVIPEWVGTRPPVEGNWTLTLEDNFDDDTLNTKYWTPRLPWTALQANELQRYSEHNVFVKDGFLHIRAEKKRGTIYDLPNMPETREYTAGAMTSFDKFSQRYGYFEARVKVCDMVGLWPAFWAMPDHGPQAERSQRRNTVNGGTEIDIFEHPTRLGPFRNNIACHWDGYGADHKKTGTSRIYMRADKDGYVNSGVLWEPGKLSWYMNGELVGVWESPAVPSVAIYLKFCVQMGSWGGFIVEDDKLPMDFTVDYVRVWQRGDLAELNQK